MGEMVKNGGFEGVIPAMWCSVGLLSGSVGFRGYPRWSIVPIFQFPVRIGPISPTNQYYAFRSRRNAWYWSDGGEGETRSAKVGKRREKVDLRA